MIKITGVTPPSSKFDNNPEFDFDSNPKFDLNNLPKFKIAAFFLTLAFGAMALAYVRSNWWILFGLILNILVGLAPAVSDLIPIPDAEKHIKYGYYGLIIAIGQLDVRRFNAKRSNDGDLPSPVIKS